jgi:MscS family membrane protein
MTHALFFPRLIAMLLALALLLSVVNSVTAQEKPPLSSDTSMREFLEGEEIANRMIAEKEQTNPDSIDAGTTPLATLLGLREAMRNLNYAKAGGYLDTRYLPEELDAFTNEELIRALTLAWNQQNVIDIASISDTPEGNLKDGLPSYRDQIGTVTLSDGKIPIYLQRVPDGQGGKVWKLSNATVALIPKMWGELGYAPAAIALGKMLPEFTFMGMTNWQVVATGLFFIFAWPVATLITVLLMRIALLIPNGFPLGIERFFRGPMRFFVFIFLAKFMVDQLALSMAARIFMESSGVDYFAITVLLLGVLSLIRDYNIRKMERAGNAQYVALLKPATTITKVLIITGIVLFWADSAGYNMSTILAGLGVGSLAVALAAQKTLENVIGAFTLYTARPVNPGDLCRFGTVVGTVEEIGLRSTVLRTLNRTQVSIPNSVFASGDIENFSVRDRIRFFHNLRLELPEPNQLRLILGEIRSLFYSHPEVLPATVSVRFEKIDDATAIIRIDAGVNTGEYQVYLAIAEDINLRIIEIVHGAGAMFSGPGQNMVLREARPEDAEHIANADQIIERLRAEEKLPFPNFSAQEIADLGGTLDYPPKGSAG